MALKVWQCHCPHKGGLTALWIKGVEQEATWKHTRNVYGLHEGAATHRKED